MQIRYNDIKFFSTRFLVFLFFVLAFGRGSSLVANFDPRINPIGYLLYMLCIVYLFGKPNISQTTKSNRGILILSSSVFAVWFFFHLMFLDEGFPIMPYTFFILHIVTGILLIKKYNENIVVYFEKAMIFLTYMSLIGWGIESLGGTSLLTKSPILLENSAGNSDYSLILYTLNYVPNGGSELYGNICRNSGCAWEPGLFSVMLCIAILFNIYQNKKIIYSKRLIVLVIGLITTFSTTGYIMGIIIFAGYYLFSKKTSLGKRIVYISIIVVGSISIYNLPFISEKIERDTDVESFSTKDGGVEWNEKENRTFTVGRFEGIVLECMNIQDKPILGYGIRRENSFIYKKISPAIITSNGIIKPFAQFGIILGVILFILMYRSTIKLSKDFLFQPVYLLFIVIILGSVSYMFDSTPIMRALQLYALYIPIKQIKKQYE